MKPSLKTIASYFALIGLLASVGCGGREENPDHLPTINVTAKVSVDGEPLDTGTVTMTPTDPAIPNSGANVQPDGTAKFGTYAPKGGIPAGEYNAGLMMNMETMKPVPGVKPLTISVTEDMEGGELPINFESTGKTQGSPLPPPPVTR